MQTLDTPVFRSRVEDFQLRHETKVVTMLFSDVVGSTQLKATLGEKEGIRALLQHHDVFRKTLATIPEGEEIGTAGDSFFLVFAKPSDAVKFALLVQKNMRRLSVETGHHVLDRIGIHVGEVWIDHTETASRAKDLYGTQVDLCARVSSLADADQILLTRFAFDSARQVLSKHDVKTFELLSWLNHGPYLMKGIDEPIEVCEVGEVGSARLMRPADSEKAARSVSSDVEPVLGWRPAVGQPVPETSWILDEKLGEGGFGEVWSGHDKLLKTQHVFKFCFRAERARSLKREVTIFRLLKERIGTHPNIVAIENVYFDHPPFYIVMQHINGQDLVAWFKDQENESKLTVELRLRLIAQVADAVQAANDTGIVHRDIKPSNILVSGSLDKAHAYLTDFGIGNITPEALLSGITQFGFTQTVTRSAGIGGTQLYMAPELLVGGTPSVRSDIYSLGVVLYQILVGDFSSPVTSDWPSEISDPLLREDLQLCFAKDPLKRFAGAGELATRLRSLSKRRADQEEQKKALVAEENSRYWGGVVLTAAVEPPTIAVLLGWALYYSDDDSGRYDYASAFHIPNYIFFITLTAMYFGVDSGMRAYYRDAAIGFISAGNNLARYVFRLCAAISGIIALQTAIVILVGNKILQIREMFWPYFGFTFLVAFGGVTLGFLLASLVKSRERSARILFLIIISQLIFGGALIKYDEMNRDLDLIYGFKRWLTRHPEANAQGTRDDSALRVPLISRFVVTHYTYEALMVAQAKLNPLTRRQDQLQHQMDDLVSKKLRTEAEAARLEDLKDTLALLSGMEAQNSREMEKLFKRVDEIIDGKALDPGLLKSKPGLTAERLYVNLKVSDLILKAEMQQNDSRRQRSVNPFFSPEKHYDVWLFGRHYMLQMSTLTYATSIVGLYSCATLFLFYWNLRLRVPPFNMRRRKEPSAEVER